MDKMSRFLQSSEGKRFLYEMYGAGEAGLENRLRVQEKRYLDLSSVFNREFGDVDCSLVSVPGRVEISGNHTDHNHGKVIAGSVSLDAAALCSGNGDMEAVFHDLQYNEVIRVNLSSLEKKESEKGSPRALIRGVAAGLKQRGFAIGGFNGVIHNDVMSGSGLSSSAVFEVAVGTMFNTLYNNGKIENIELAKIGKFAENEYFGKPCGLMDQTACAVGGMILIDFKNPEEPSIEKIRGDLEDYVLTIVKTGGDHAGLTDQYAAIPKEMKCAASLFGQEVLAGVTFPLLVSKGPEIRRECGDRAFLRALHFIAENERVEQQRIALGKNDRDTFLRLVNESGASSWKNLQNVSVDGDPLHQEMAATLAVSEYFIKGRGRGAVRVHGGGFGGTILAFIHRDDKDAYRSVIEQITGKGSTSVLTIRGKGAVSFRL